MFRIGGVLPNWEGTRVETANVWQTFHLIQQWEWLTRVNALTYRVQIRMHATKFLFTGVSLLSA